MKVLQLGENNWQSEYELPKDLDWHFNDFSIDIKKVKYDVIIVTGKTNLDAKALVELADTISPYHVLYSASILSELNDNERSFLNNVVAQEIKESPQELIEKLNVRYFFGQSGIRFFPDNIKLNEQVINSYEYLDKGHLKLSVDTKDEWINIGSYRDSVFIDPDKLINLWLSFENQDVEVRLKVFIRVIGDTSNQDNEQILNLTDFSEKEYPIGIAPEEAKRGANISIEVKGKGELTIGVLHSRWCRDSAGTFIAGGKRIINPKNGDDIAYYFHPGDLKPPLNVYFSGARDIEGFEGFFLFRQFKAPMLLFTDMRLEVGQFYDDSESFFENAIIDKIKEKLDELGFDESELVMSGMSMGTYPALKYGSELGAHAIVLSKPVLNLGYCATRAALQRPDDFELVFDIDNNIANATSEEQLKKMDNAFWKKFDKQDLSATKIFAAHMLNDDYDDIAIDKMKKSKAINNVSQLSVKGFPGRHTDSSNAVGWFIDRFNAILSEDFKREI